MNTEHPNEEALYLHAAGDKPLADETRLHVAGCDECRERTADLRAVVAALRALPPTPPPSPELTGRLRMAIGGPPSRRAVGGMPRRAAALGAAAALVIFAAGIVVGQQLASPAPRQWDTVRTTDVQRAGTDYVASLASLAAESDHLTPEKREQLREVTLAAMFGAAFELRRFVTDDSVTAELYRATRAAWLGDTQAGPGVEE